MTRTSTLIATGLTTLALSACGTAATTSSPTTSPAAPTATTQVQQAVQQVVKPSYFNMSTLETAMRSAINKRAADPSNPHYLPGWSLSNVTCIRNGAQTATCLATASNGQTDTANVTIAADGNSWISSATH